MPSTEELKPLKYEGQFDDTETDYTDEFAKLKIGPILVVEDEGWFYTFTVLSF